MMQFLERAYVLHFTRKWVQVDLSKVLEEKQRAKQDSVASEDAALVLKPMSRSLKLEIQKARKQMLEQIWKGRGYRHFNTVDDDHYRICDD